MSVCPKCHKYFKTAQGLAGHLRFRHQMVVPRQDLPVYAKDRLEKAEAENARLREQLNRGQRQRQDLETFYEKKVEEKDAQLKEMQVKAAGQQLESLKQRDERSWLQKTLEEQRTALQKQQQEFQKQVENLEMQKAQFREVTERQNQKSSELEKRLHQMEKQEPKQSGVEELRDELERLKSQLDQNQNRSQSFSLLPPTPNKNPVGAVRDWRDWLHRFNH